MNDLHEITGWSRPQVRSQPALTADRRPRVYDLDERTWARAETQGGISWQKSFHLRTIRPSPNGLPGLIIIVGPDPPEARKAATRAPAGHTRSAGGAREPPKDAEGRQAHSQEGDPRDQLNR
jgi:hypothetical protein